MSPHYGTWQRLAFGYAVRLPVWNRKRMRSTWRPTLDWAIASIRRRLRRIERQDARHRQRGVVHWQQRRWTW